MPAVTRELTIVYGSLTTGGSSDYLIDGPYQIDQDYESASVRWRVVVASATESGFATACSTVETAMRAINGALTVTLGSATLLSLSHSSGTGYLARPAVRVLEEIQTGRSRRYELSVSCRRPADASGKNRLRSANIEVVRSAAGWRVLRVAGAYTCNGATGAKATHDANVATYIGTLTTALTGTWERSGDSAVSYDDEDKEARFTEVYREVPYNQSAGVLNNASLVDQRLSISVTREAPGDAPGASRWRRVAVSYSATVDKGQTTDLVGLYEGAIRPHLLSEAASAAGGAVFALVSEAPTFDRTASAITAALVALVLGDSNTIELSVLTVEDESNGRIFVPVHGDDPYARIEFPGFAQKIRTVIVDRLSIGTVQPLASVARGLAAGEGYRPLGSGTTTKSLRIGLPEAGGIATIETVRIPMVYATAPPAALSAVAPGDDAGRPSATTPRT